MKKLIQSISLLLLTTAVLSAQPKWNPVIYTNSTTLYGKVTINGVPAQFGDKVGVFVGDECRGVADVVTNLDEGYVSILIQGEVSEEASFKIWKQNNDVVYKVFNKVITSPGSTIGTPPDYFLIDGNGPDWKPVIYTNSTTLYGIVTINNISAQPGDVVGAFVNGECRGSEEVIMNNDTAYVTMLIQGESVENVSFEIWQSSSNKGLLVPKQISSDPGGTISFININAVNGLVAFFPFNNNLIDETKNGFDISGSGLKFVQDRFNAPNTSVAFDGSTSQAEVTNSTSLNFPQNGFTISTWVKYSGNNNAVIFGKHVHGYYNGYFLAAVNNQLQFYVSGIPITTSETFNDNTWHLVTGVYDGANATLYVDGVQKLTQRIAYTAFSPNPVRLAYMQTAGYPEKYNGLIDDARIYNVPLTQAEVSTLFSENNWTAQTINVLNPNGENRIKANSIYQIDWSAGEYIDSVKIEFTPDDGRTWEVIAPSLPGISGSFNWRVPRISTTQAKIRISHLTSGVFAISSAPFIIELPVISVAAPNGGEFWQAGSQQNISWNALNINNVKIEYSSNNGMNWNTIATTIPATQGNYSWAVSNDTTSKALIRVSDEEDSSFNDVSNSPFTVFQPKLDLTSPLGGEQWVIGTTQNITWTSSNVANVKLEYTTDNGSNWISILTSTPAAVGSFIWTIPNTPSVNCKIRISDVTNIAVPDLSDNVFSIILPKVTVTFPNGGEQWVVGTTQNITWTSSNVANVKLDYTTNNGTNWISILTSTPASAGSYVWTIPNAPSTNCLVRVSDVANIAVPDLSDNVFSIILPKVTVTTPNGGEQWIVGTTQNITWTNSNVANVKLEYTTDNGSNWISILASTPAAAGSFVWTIPNAPSTNCKVRISDVTNSLFADTSNSVFSIILPKVTITAPNGGEQWIVGTTQNITWTSSNVANVKLEYTTDNGSNWISILASTPATAGSFVWTIPNTPSTNCLVRVSDVANIAVPDLSDNVFSIILPKVTVTFPNGGEQWVVGTTQNITWTSSNVANVKLDYTTNNGTNWISILTSTPASAGSYVWTIPNAPSTNCLVRVSDVANIAVPDLSDNVFSIILPKVTVTTPNGGEQWIVGTTQNITWTNSNVANVKLEYTTDNGSNWISILASTPAAAGSFVWTIPNAPSTNCLVRVSDVANIAVPDLSDNVFSIILPKVTVTAPNGGEQWVVGTTQNITWTSSNVANVKLEYTTNNGTNWNSILASTPASAGSYVWTIPNTPSTNCLVRVSDVTNIAVPDLSDNVFSIILPKVTVTAPNGAEQWVVGTTQNITWTSSNVSNVKIEYTTNNGTNWNSILTSTPASAGSYVWTVPNTPSINCLVRVSDVTNFAVPDLSDNVFSIILPKVTVTAPNGGEQWIVGTTQNITWTSSNVANVKLEYTTNNGTNWNSILASTPAAAGNFVWTIPNTPSANCRVRISDVTNSLFADTSNSVFSIILPKVTVTAPNGGEQWIVGTTQNISWTSSNVANIKLEYTTDNGSNWISILASTPAAAGNFVWTIPNTPSANCKVRISDVTNSAFADISDNLFSIFLPQITVLKPNGGENFIVGKTDTIKWTSANVANVKLEYTTNNGTDWISILASTPASAGSFVWTIPNTPSTNCKVRISDVTNSAFADVSDNLFSILLPQLTVLKPNGGENFIVGKTDTIKWSSANVANVKLEYTTDNGSNWISILTSTPAAAGSYVWTIPNTPSANCKVRISDVTNSSFADASDNVFSIILPKVTVTAPNGGEQWIVGTTQNITWTSSNVANVKLEYTTNNGTNWNSILASTPATAGSFVWTIPNTPSVNCLVRVSDVTNIAVPDLSDNVFSIILPKVTVTSPNGAEQWIVGATQNITWTSSNVANVKLEYTTNNGTDWISILASTPASAGSYVWTIPNAPSTNCLVRVSDVANIAVPDLSDNVFSIILPKVTVTTPNGGEQWIVGTTQNITWTNSNVANVKLEYTTDNGSNWISILASTPAAAGSFVWTIPNAPSTNCLVRVSDVANIAVPDLSDNVFSIILPKVTVASPNGGEQLIVGTTQNITWTSSNVANVKLEYTTDNGSNWISILASTPAAAGSFVWTIPNTPSANCKVRISDVTNSAFADVSDNVFSILLPQITVLKPNGGENFVVGKTDTIKWSGSNVANVKLEYTTDNGSNWISILASTPATAGSFVWTIPNTPSANCRVRISDVTNSAFADVSDNLFSIFLPQITVLKPNGGENFVIGKTDTIKWSGSNVANVKLEYTTDNGSNWISILASTPATAGSFVWTIPNTPSANCRVRISDVTNSAFADVSDNLFSILLPKITVLKPNGGENFVVGKTDTIKWLSANITNVKLVYSTNNGTDWISILTSTPASTGSFVWTIPNTPSTNCLVSISDVANSSFTDISDNVFSIVNPGIVLDKPIQGDRYRYGSIVPITWHSTNVDNVNLEFSSDNGATWTMIVSNANAAPGEYNWTLPQNLSQNISIKVSDAKFPLIFSTSGLIEIFIPTVQITSPIGGEKWQGGTEQAISWTQKDVTRLKIEYTLDDNSWISIPDTIDANVGSYGWLIPKTESINARVRLTETIDTLVRDKSPEVFTIFIPKLAVTMPNGGETFVAGKIDTIKWTSGSLENVKLEFTSDNGLNWSSIITSTPAGSGMFVWTIPNSPSKNCKVKISDVLNPELTDQSDLPFTIIAPTITLLSPNGGEKWLAQTNQQISWTSSDLDSISIDYSLDNGTTWNVIAPKVFAWDAIYNWNVESLPSSQALIRVSKYDDLSVQDVSDNVFTIYKEALAVTSPNGGEKLRAKTVVPITWNISEIVNPKARKKNLGDAQVAAIAPIQNIKIEFTSDNGINWSMIAASVNAELKSYNWQVPVLESKNCLIRITDIGDATHSDTSDNVFEIYSPNVTITSPNGGERWRAASINKISWISSEINKVRIEYSTNDGFEWKIISDSTEAATGSIDWTIPSERTNKARVRVTDISLASTADTSDNSFTIVVPEIKITSPAGGENWKTNTVQQIKWNSLDVELVSVEFSSNSGTTWTMIKDSVLASAGLYNWTIPRTPTEQAQIKISDVAHKEISVTSNSFSIIKPLALLTPQGGEKWFSGSTQQIKWNFNLVDSVKLEYSLNNGASWQLIANSLPATLLIYDWRIPQNIASTQCRVKITDKSNYMIADSSIEVFTIMTPTLTVLTPNGEENLKGGSEYQITWKNQNSDSLIVDCSIDNGTTWAPVTKSCNAKAEKLTWIVPKVTSTQCRIRVIDKYYTTVADTSDKVFSIYTPEITIVTPKGGETWYVGETKQIKWKSSFVESVKIVLTTDDGSSWRTLTNSISASDSVFSLFIEKTPSTNCRIKISATEDPMVLDSSRSNFAIAILPPSIRVSIYQNPVLTQYCNVVLVSDSLLSALPTTSIWRTGDTEIPVYEMKPVPNSTNVFECSVKFDTTAIYNISSRVISRMGIEKDTLRQFAVGMVLPNSFAKVSSKNQGLSLLVNPGVVDEKTFLSIEEEKVNKEIVYNLQPAKTFKKAIGVELSFANETFEEVYKLSLFVFENGEWKPVPSKVNKKEKTVTASFTTLGKVKLGIDVNKKEEIDLPQTFALIQNYPNPFNPSTVIAFHLPEDCDVTLEIYNMLGARITTLHSGFAVAGRYSVIWNGLNNANVQVPSGVYLYRLKTSKFDQVRKMILLK